MLNIKLYYLHHEKINLAKNMLYTIETTDL